MTQVVAFHAEVAVYCAFTLTQHWTAIQRGFKDECCFHTHILFPSLNVQHENTFKCFIFLFVFKELVGK
jgi:hypothetical protein